VILVTTMNTKYLAKREPITSYGVINLHLSGELEQYAETLKTSHSNIETNALPYIKHPEQNKKYMDILKMVEKNLTFLLVSRNHSLGYIEFIRGRYDISDSHTIEHLFIQMTETEIFNIFTMSFDDLWCELWKKNAKKNIYNKEYSDAISKYSFIKLHYTRDSFKPQYPVSEWGFPKGRKNNSESNMQCASRECCEETSLNNKELNMLTGVSPLIECMTGTNNVCYKHVYYLSVVDHMRPLNINNDAYHFIEIDTVGWFKKSLVNNLLRPYHTEKLNIINKIIQFVAYVVYKCEP